MSRQISLIGVDAIVDGRVNFYPGSQYWRETRKPLSPRKFGFASLRKEEKNAKPQIRDEYRSYLSESGGVLRDPGNPGDGDEDGRLVRHVLHPDEDGGRGGVDLAKIGRPVASKDLKVVARLPLVVEVLRGMSPLSHFIFWQKLYCVLVSKTPTSILLDAFVRTDQRVTN